MNHGGNSLPVNFLVVGHAGFDHGLEIGRYRPDFENSRVAVCRGHAHRGNDAGRVLRGHGDGGRDCPEMNAVNAFLNHFGDVVLLMLV